MIPSKKQMLWWGRSDPDYSRNSVVRQNLAAQGWEIRDFHPKISALGDITAALFRTPTPDVVWVPCFRSVILRQPVAGATEKAYRSFSTR